MMGNARFLLSGSAVLFFIVITYALSSDIYNPKMPRMEPNILKLQSGHPVTQPYSLSADTLNQLRSELLYSFYDQGGPENFGDYQKNIQENSPMIKKVLNFRFPFFGMEFNYIWVSLHGHLAFSNGPTLSTQNYPLTFSIPSHLHQTHPPFIGPLYTKLKIEELSGDEVDNRRPGVYFRLETNLMSRTDQLGVELRGRTKSDIQEGIVGAESFEPRHAIITTSKSVTFDAESIHAYNMTNTFQAVLVTDETRTYVMFNYQHLGETAHAEAGGSSEFGSLGASAFIGFNAGNQSRAYNYKQLSQSSELMYTGNINGKPGRHIFRVDQKTILPGQCDSQLYETSVNQQKLSYIRLNYAPQSGNMLGGTIVNVAGPCFDFTKKVTCTFNTIKVVGTVIDINRATCIMPPIQTSGYIDLFVDVEGYNHVLWTGKFLVNAPPTRPGRSQ